MMFPNDKFLVYFPDSEIPEGLPFAYRSCCLKIGSCVIIQKVMDEYNLRAMLHKRLGDDTGLFLDLVAYLIVEEDNAGQYYPDYAFTHPLFSEKMRIYSDSKVSRLLNSITKDQCTGFLDDRNKNCDHKSRIYISDDSTNKNCQAGDIDLVEFGHAKDDKGLPVFNLSIAMDKTNRVPLFYEEYPGSITDVSQFTFMVDKVIDYGYRKIGFILDRGYFCIITSENMSASQALIQYKGRDISEKLFRSDKTFIGSRSDRIQSSESMSNKIFIEFVALIVRERIYNLLKEQMLKLESRQKYLTVPAAIRELEKIEMIRRNGSTYKLDHAVTKTQKIILQSFGLDETNIIKSANEISKLLASSQSLMNKEAPEDGKEEVSSNN